MTSKTTLGKPTTSEIYSQRLRRHMIRNHLYLTKLGGGQDGDLILAFFPCIYFCDAKVMLFKGEGTYQRKWSVKEIMDRNIQEDITRHEYFQTLMKLVSVCSGAGIRLIIENPWNTSRMTYLQTNFIDPTIIDSNRAKRGDYFVKPTAYWFIGCEPTKGFTFQENKNPLVVYKQGRTKHIAGVCNEDRSKISPDYARNFICDSIIGKSQPNIDPTLFD